MSLLGKTLERLENLVKDGNFYEAQQTYKTTYHRQRAKKQVVASYQVLESGALAQFQAKQITCGVELGLLLVQAYKEDEEKNTNEDACRRLSNIIDAFPNMDITASNIEELSRLVKSIINWVCKSVGTGDSSSAALVSRRMHGNFGRYIWKNRSLLPNGTALSIIHLIRSDDPFFLAKVVISSSRLGPDKERGLWIVRSTLQCLAIANRRTTFRQLAHTMDFVAAVKKSLASGQEPCDDTQDDISEALKGGDEKILNSPSLTFVDALILAIRKKCKELVELLAAKYSPILNLDPSLRVLFSRMQRVYFPTPGGGGGLANLLGGLLGGLGDFGDDEDED